jgi:hypothetical protein
MRRLVLALAAMLMTSASAKTGEPGQPRYDCPTVYHSWLPTHIMERFGWSETHRPSMFEEVINKVHVFKDKAIVTWGGKGGSSIYERTYNVDQSDYFFTGKGDNGSRIAIYSDTEYQDYRPNNNCNGEIYYAKEGDRLHSYQLLMKKID